MTDRVAYLVEPNDLSHPKMKPDLVFDRPHKRTDWDITPLCRERDLIELQLKVQELEFALDELHRFHERSEW